MPNLNQVNLMGNMTRDPEMKYTPKGTAICGFGLAINRQWKNDAGEKMEKVTFVDIEAWGRTGEVIGEYFKKGAPIFITGRLELDQWDDKTTGQRRQKLKVVAESFEFLAGAKGAAERPEADASAGQRRPGGSSTPPQRPPARPAPPKDPDLDQPEDDIPF